MVQKYPIPSYIFSPYGSTLEEITEFLQAEDVLDNNEEVLACDIRLESGELAEVKVLETDHVC